MKKIVLFIISSILLVQNIVFSQEKDIDIYLVAYVNRLKNKVESNWILPHGELDKKTIIVFKINREGKILNVNIAEKSGGAEFDQNALTAIYKSVPFEDIPNNVKDEDITIRFTFSQLELEATPISKATNTNVVNQITYANNQTPTLVLNAYTSEIKEKPQVKKTSHKTYNGHKREGTHGYNGQVTGKTIAAGALSLLIWPGLGQLMNDEPSEKVITHAILGIIDVFRIWSCYDAVVDRRGGVWNNRI